MSRVTTDPWKYLNRIEFNGSDAHLEKMEYPNYPDNCWTLDTSNRTSSFIRFVFNQDSAYSAQINIEDKLSSQNTGFFLFSPVRLFLSCYVVRPAAGSSPFLPFLFPTKKPFHTHLSVEGLFYVLRVVVYYCISN